MQGSRKAIEAKVDQLVDMYKLFIKMGLFCKKSYRQFMKITFNG